MADLDVTHPNTSDAISQDPREFGLDQTPDMQE